MNTEKYKTRQAKWYTSLLVIVIKGVHDEIYSIDIYRKSTQTDLEILYDYHPHYF